ncbi:Protein PLANT CADMIUM RESISTANCE 9-like [Heracleum sosnowskyi]|uniref:Protein PLANT CADMIUM RESISTANCE 9-like n=1 Tax=Heracleum sosnowskyi TaxID=360622 RepID=A0AAD8ILE4_9APIA|nr:Protein PLANT CADMIUM RESISTANCE 9-like [Heracleum sosnowskyi]
MHWISVATEKMKPAAAQECQPFSCAEQRYWTGCGWILSCFYRSKIRKQYMLKKSPCGDCLLHFFCVLCALCQEHRELHIRGYDMSLGWKGNMEKQNRGLTTAPKPEGGMTRSS